jgi:hypothetical protein
MTLGPLISALTGNFFLANPRSGLVTDKMETSEAKRGSVNDILQRIIHTNLMQNELDREQENSHFSIDSGSNKKNSRPKKLITRSPILYQYFTQEQLVRAEKCVYEDIQRKELDSMMQAEKQSSYSDGEENELDDAMSITYYQQRLLNPSHRLNLALDSPISVYMNLNFLIHKGHFNVDANGYFYIGQIDSHSQKCGKGATFWPDGVMYYEGDYFGGKKIGFGQFYWRNGGFLYRGEVKDGAFEGYGVKYNLLGKRESSGVWANGILQEEVDVVILEEESEVGIFVGVGQREPKKSYYLLKPHLYSTDNV